ncbi:MAG: beta galactosidase jelly roll domain-containing protein, partial [Prevotella sp.]|nr:beta galactosidase jelly roll domain-containing protein [Prevotella sp.]
MKQKIFSLFIMAAFALTVQAKELPLIGSVLSRESASLNGEWNYIVDVQEEGYYDYRMNPTRWGFFRNAKPQKPEDLIEYDFDLAPTMHIPGDWNTQDERLFFYEGTVWFKTSFQAQVPIEGGYRTLLYFGAVNYDCRVWVNGREAGHHEGGFTPFNLDVTDLLISGENVVIVKVDNKRHADAVPTQIFAWWNYGGITRDVMLVRVPATYIEHFKLQLEPADAKARQRQIAFSAQLDKALASQRVTLSIPELKITRQFITDAQGRAKGLVTVPSKKLSLWSPDNPK